MSIKTTASALFAAAFLATSGAALSESSDPIKIAINEWTGQHISAHISGSLLQKAGYTVEYVTAGAVPQFAAIAQGNLHLQPETWGNNVGEIYPKSVASGDIVQLGLLGLEPQEGWMFPPYMKEKCPGLPDVQALIKCTQAFATAETFPNGRLITYPADWGTRSKDLVKNAGLPLQPIAGGSEGAMIAEMQAARKTNQPMLVMFWAPHWIHSEYDWEWVELPAPADDCETNPQPGFDPNTTGDCGFEQADITKIVSKNFEADWPGAFKLMQELTIDNDTMNSLMLEVDNKKRKLEDVIAEWVDGNEATWKPWVDAAKL